MVVEPMMKIVSWVNSGLQAILYSLFLSEMTSVFQTSTSPTKSKSLQFQEYKNCTKYWGVKMKKKKKTTYIKKLPPKQKNVNLQSKVHQWTLLV